MLPCCAQFACSSLPWAGPHALPGLPVGNPGAAPGGWAVGENGVRLSVLFAGFGYGPPPPPPDQFAPPGVPPPPATPGAAPLAFPPPPSQAAPDMSKPPAAQPDFPYSQYGEWLRLSFPAAFMGQVACLPAAGAGMLESSRDLGSSRRQAGSWLLGFLPAR